MGELTVNGLTLPEHLSFSQASTILRCGEQYRLERGLGFRSRPMWAGVGGSAVHKVSEDFDHKLLESGEVMPDSDLRAAFDNVFAAEVAATEERTGVPQSEWYASGRASKAHPNKEDKSWWLEQGQAFSLAWKSWRMVAPWEVWIDPHTGQPGIEYSFDVELGGVQVKGFIDRIMVSPEGAMVVLDLKTSAREPDNTMQLGTYAQAFLAQEGVLPSYGAYWMARTGSTTMPKELRGWTKDRLDFTYGEADHRRKNNRLLASPSNMCSACGVAKFCYAVGGSEAHRVPSPFTSI